MNYRDEIKGLRAKHNITQEEAANLLGISRVSYKNKELGKTKFYYEEVIKLLMYLDELSYLTNSSTYFFTL